MKKKEMGHVKVILLALVLVLLGFCIWQHEVIRCVFYSIWDPQNPLDVDAPWDGKAYLEVQYADVSESDYLNLYVPASDEPVPLLVLIHGGGFVTNECESRQVQLVYQYMRKHGYACATVNYRLAQEAKFPEAIRDVKAAVRFLRANAGEYGINADRIAVFGESAGGYLALMAAVTAEDEFNDLPFIGENEETPVSAEISAVLDYYGASVLETHAERLAAFQKLGIPGFVITLSEGWLRDAMRGYGDFDSVEDFWLDMNVADLSEAERSVFQPMAYIAKNLNRDSDLHVLIWHGDADITVPRTQSEELYSLLCKTIGEDHTAFRLFHNAKHADEDMYSDESLEQVRQYLDMTVNPRSE